MAESQASSEPGLAADAAAEVTDSLRGTARMPGLEPDAFNAKRYLADIEPSDFADQLHQAWESRPGLREAVSFDDFVTATLEWNSGRGAEKPMGYISLADLVSCRPNPMTFVSELAAKGITTRVFPYDVCKIWPGALYSYSEPHLQALLDARQDVLTEYGWPTTAEEFVAHVAEETAPARTPLFDVIADAFADYKNPLRLEYPTQGQKTIA